MSGESRESQVLFLKRLWRGEETPCPQCGVTLTRLHKKAKKSNNDWQCPGCGKIIRTIQLLYELPEK